MPRVRLAGEADLSPSGPSAAAYRKYVDRMPVPPAPMLRDYTEAVDQGTVHVLEAGSEVVGVVSLAGAGDQLLVENLAVPGPSGDGTQTP